MKLITLSEPFCITLRKSAGVDIARFEAGKPYILHSAQLARLRKDHEHFRNILYKFSDLESRIAPFHIAAYKPPAKILFYNGSGGYGDQIMTWPVVKILADQGFEMHLLTDPGNCLCWFNFPWIRSIRVLPVELSYLEFFDGCALFELVSNGDEHPDQLHTVDKLLTMLGIDYRCVPPEMKVCKPMFTTGEIKTARSIFADKKLAFYQLAATSKHRCFTPEMSALIFRHLANAFPQFYWVGLYDSFIPDDYKKAAESTKAENSVVYQSPDIRALWALMSRAELVVSPDSMSVHVAGSMGRRCVGLWGVTDPKNRVAYYKRHTPIHKKGACPFAPCHTYHTIWPSYCPNGDQRQMCDVMSAITIDDIINACNVSLSE